jgi:hypothetical protein
MRNSINFPLCSIITVNYNSKPYLKNCLDSLEKQTYPNCEIIVVDNASTDNSIEIVKKYPKIKLIENKINLGFAGGMNTGIRKAKGKYVAMIDSDTIADRNWISELIKVMKSNKSIGIVGGKIYLLTPKGEKTNSLRYVGGKLHKFFNFYLLGSKIGQNKEDTGLYENLIEVDFIHGCGFLVRNDIFNGIGLMDEEYFMYGEEIDWCYRVRDVGYKIFYVPSAIIWHVGSPGVGKVSYKKTYYVQRSNIRLILKLFELHWIIWYVFFSGILHMFLKLSYAMIKGVFTDDLRAIYDAVKWNIKNIKKTLEVRKEWKIRKMKILKNKELFYVHA